MLGAGQQSHRKWAGLDVDGVGVLLAQRFVLLRVERLTLQVHMAHLRESQRTGGQVSGQVDRQTGEQVDGQVDRCYRADEAGVVPGVAQSLDELVTSFNWEVAAVTLGAEESDVVWEEDSY